MFNCLPNEKVQRRFIKRLRSLKHMPYSDRLLKLGLPSLELRRLHLDLVYCYKIVFGLVKLHFSDFFEFSVLPTRGHAYKLDKYRCKSVRADFVACRVVNVWNSLQSFLFSLACELLNGLSEPSILACFKNVIVSS